MVVWLSIFIFLCVVSCCLLCCCSVAVDRPLRPPRNQDQNHNGNYNHISVLGQPSAAQSGAVSPPYYENEPTQKEEEERIVFTLLKSRLKLETIPNDSALLKSHTARTSSIRSNSSMDYMKDTVRTAAISSRFLRKILHNANSCSICLEDYQSGDEICRSHNVDCNHYFHSDCMVRWLMKNKSEECPLCRAKYLVDVASTTNNLPTPVKVPLVEP